MGNHHFYWVNPRTKKWPCSIANCNKLPEVMYDDPRFKALTPLGTSLFFLSRRLPGTPLLLTVTSDWNHVSMWIFHIHTYIYIYIYGTKKNLHIYIYIHIIENMQIYPIDIPLIFFDIHEYLLSTSPNISPISALSDVILHCWFFSANVAWRPSAMLQRERVCLRRFVNQYIYICMYVHIYIYR